MIFRGIIVYLTAKHAKRENAKSAKLLIKLCGLCVILCVFAVKKNRAVNSRENSYTQLAINYKTF